MKTKERIRGRNGRYVKECRYCACPVGCACSPEDPCPCGYPKLQMIGPDVPIKTTPALVKRWYKKTREVQ